ncbi:hypothetical protein MITSMUL_05487 [Mitsuokella multacida DSM 20544]|uniref:Uncharacterized protein n=1 Tax=Mitsuokella multacida DSM 20544 TaxID=500635 RepID=C9KQH0_9FIRM|nr:hypothetical protein MITSMUL_05487 [Mitsuokella multacida DSM 20544]
MFLFDSLQQSLNSNILGAGAFFLLVRFLDCSVRGFLLYYSRLQKCRNVAEQR